MEGSFFDKDLLLVKDIIVLFDSIERLAACSVNEPQRRRGHLGMLPIYKPRKGSWLIIAVTIKMYKGAKTGPSFSLSGITGKWPETS